MDRIAIIMDASARVREVLAPIRADAPVPTCPEWDTLALAQHLAQVHAFWAAILGRGLVNEEDVAELERELAAATPQDEDLPAALVRLEGATAALAAQLRELGDSELRWSWWEAEQNVGFTRRMQTYEATMHRVDAELAADLDPSPIAPDVASGAIDHAVDVMWGWVPPESEPDWTHVVALEASDTGERWLVRVGSWSAAAGEVEASGSVAARAEFSSSGSAPTPSKEADAVARGNVADLALWAWGRGGEVEVLGAPDAVTALGELIAAGIQ